MTDRQTDRSACWSVTAYNDEINLLEDADTFPVFVEEVYGGVEACPTTGKLHFQGAIVLRCQQRRSALKKWLPTAHLEPAIKREALIKYAMKKDTAVGEKTVRQNKVPYLRIHDKMRLLAQAYLSFSAEDVDKELEYRQNNPKDGELWYLVTKKLLPVHGAEIVGAFADAEVRTVWRNTKEFWIRQDPELRQPPLSITEAADQVE